MDAKSNSDEYYKAYHSEHGDQGYRLKNIKNMSRPRIITEWLRENLKPGAKVLDVGCGDMALAELSPEFEWHGIDISTDVAEKAIQHDLGVKPYPFPNSCFDAIVCSEVLEHLWNPTIVHDEAKRMLKPKGQYIVSTPNMHVVDNFLTHFKLLRFQDKQTHNYEHIRWYTLEDHNKLIIPRGFEYQDHSGGDCFLMDFFKESIHNLIKHKFVDSVEDADYLLAKCIPSFNVSIMVRYKKK